MLKTCQNCGITYDAPPSIRKKYCSQECYHNSKPRSTTINCAVCGKATKSNPSRPRTYCSKSCARTATNLTDRNPSFHRDTSGAKNPMYGKRGSLHNNWKGGRTKRKGGYIWVLAPNNHPYPTDIRPSGAAYIFEHRLVAERTLNRYLLPTEVVHHIDENPSNNAPENLQVFSSNAAHIKHHATAKEE